MGHAEVRLANSFDEVSHIPLGYAPVRALLLLAERGLATFVRLYVDREVEVLEESRPVRLLQPAPFPEHLG